MPFNQFHQIAASICAAADGTPRAETNYNVSACEKTATGRYKITLNGPVDSNQVMHDISVLGAAGADGASMIVAQAWPDPTSATTLATIWLVRIAAADTKADVDAAFSFMLTQRL